MGWQPDYATHDEFASFARVDDDLDDDEIAVWLTAASRAVDKATNRQFGQVDTPVERVYDWSDMWCDADGRYVVGIDDVQDTAGMTVNGTALADTGAVLLPRNAVADGLAYTAARFTSDPRSDGDVAFVAPWGWTDVPTPVKHATLLQANRFRIRRDSPHGVAGSPEAGSDLRVLSRLDPDVLVTLRGLVRRRRSG